MDFTKLPRGHRRVVILGSTGSIGTQALEVIASAPDRFSVAALAAGGRNPAMLAQQAVATRAPAVGAALCTESELEQAVGKAADAAGVRGYNPQIVAGPDAARRLAAWPDADVVLNGITGSIGLAPTLAALRAGHLLALANKESLIVGGQLVKDAAAPGQLVPVDSEHSALAQALRSGLPDEVDRLVLTASGGPFRGMSPADLTAVTPAQALAHPTWTMGRVVTTNSATMVNKALEVSPPDMRLPIALGIGWPYRVPGSAAACDWSTPAGWTFEPLDEEAFPAVRLAKAAAAASGTSMAVFNAANEEAVEAFHAGIIGFTDIVDTVAAVVAEHSESGHSESGHTGAAPGAADAGDITLEAVLDAERRARASARARCGMKETSAG
jgi:1-deoxy-D-xylulose-5-phosphate reductoisomerase